MTEKQPSQAAVHDTLDRGSVVIGIVGTSNGRPWPPVPRKEPTPAEEIGKPDAIVTKEKHRGMSAKEARDYAQGKLGKPNEDAINGHAPGTLRAVAATANGGRERWRILFQWEPIK